MEGGWTCGSMGRGTGCRGIDAGGFDGGKKRYADKCGMGKRNVAGNSAEAGGPGVWEDLNRRRVREGGHYEEVGNG